MRGVPVAEPLLEVKPDVRIAGCRPDRKYANVRIFAASARRWPAVRDAEALEAVLVLARGDEVHWMVVRSVILDDGVHGWFAKRQAGGCAQDYV